MTAWMIGIISVMTGFGLLLAGVKMGRRIQQSRCGCDVDPFGMDAGGCACGGSCGCGH